MRPLTIYSFVWWHSRTIVPWRSWLIGGSRKPAVPRTLFSLLIRLAWHFLPCFKLNSLVMIVALDGRLEFYVSAHTKGLQLSSQTTSDQLMWTFFVRCWHILNLSDSQLDVVFFLLFWFAFAWQAYKCSPVGAIRDCNTPLRSTWLYRQLSSLQACCKAGVL